MNFYLSSLSALSSQGIPSVLSSPAPLVYSYDMRGYYPPFYPLSSESLTERSSPSNVVHTTHTQLTNQDMETRRASQQNQKKSSEKSRDEIERRREGVTEEKDKQNNQKLSDDDEGKPTERFLNPFFTRRKMRSLFV